MYHFFVEENQIKDSRIYVNGADYNHVRNVSVLSTEIPCL